MARRRLIPVIVAVLWTGPAGAQAGPSAKVAPVQCSVPNLPVGSRCATYPVFENRETRSGRTISVSIAVMPAVESPAEPDPLFILAGGPGQAASGLAGFAASAFAEVRRRRDIVLVDLPGTGRSGGLFCSLYRSPRDLAGDLLPPARIRACRDSLAAVADLGRYTTSVLMDDLDEVRGALGYDKINIYGTSYGTRATLVYVRRHRDHVRSIMLKAIAPPTMRGTMHYARDTDRSLGMLFTACIADSGCSKAFPGLETEFQEVLSRADHGTLHALIPHPAEGPAEDLVLSRGLVASTMLGLLQNSNSAVRLPMLIHSTWLGDTKPLADAILAYRRGLDGGIAIGMYLSVMCSEDADRMDPAGAARADKMTALGDYRVAQLAGACRLWVKGPVPADFAAPVKSDVPALLVSGTLDPNTNEHWGEDAARYLSRSLHVVIPNLSHGFSSVATCGGAFMAVFIAKGTADGLDVSCKDTLKLPPFVLPNQ